MKHTFKELFKGTTVKISYLNDGIFLEVNTRRLLIRSVREEDIDFFQNLWADVDVMKMFGTGEQRLYCGSNEQKQEKLRVGATPDYAEWRIRDMDYSWLERRKDGNIWHGLTVCLKDTNRAIGHIVIAGTGEVAYFFCKDFWNQGYASESAMAMVRIAVPYIMINYPELGCPNEINATVRIDHPASQKVLGNTGFEIDEKTKIFEKYGHSRYGLHLSTEKLILDYQREQNYVDKIKAFVSRNRGSLFVGSAALCAFSVGAYAISKRGGSVYNSIR